MADERIETDSLGEIAVPGDAYWGAQTQRAIENFPISDRRFGRRFIRAIGLVKLGAARANRDLGHLDDERADAIESACEEVVAGEHDDQFPVDVFQTGSGTSTNMNANEVIANRASEIYGAAVGSKAIHPNDHVNFGQSSNDVIPTAMHVAARESVAHDLLPGLRTLETELAAQADAFDDVVKTGRTHLQDATPIRLGQEFGGYRRQIEKAIDRIERASTELDELALGGTAVGTGLNTDPEFAERAIAEIAVETDLDFREADDHFEAQAAHDAMGAVHGTLRSASGAMDKIANDLRLLASGPRNGLGEIDQPENQPGSSIMPGKINPVVAESVNQVHARVLGNDATVQAGAERGQIDLNLYKPVLADAFVESAGILGRAAETFGTKFVAKLEADHEHCADQVERSMALATALNPAIGYDAASTVAKKALATGQTVRETAIEMGHLTPEEADEVLDPARMTSPGILGEE
ncbi:class II fumarate hydratase [Halococcoides cellulosivorans]|uniref:Fumarate hydratase class II n=1 Tax=Halococcoides cellulosivorans TaxID=1679096 RepID=A0A2R4WZR5_9EURY|nr:class II fumarate hydratase [Halococcoides cellulosivorans]AWB27019.1 aspartate ammonia-lyase [Halococcoides cellulosivorans]